MSQLTGFLRAGTWGTSNVVRIATFQSQFAPARMRNLDQPDTGTRQGLTWATATSQVVGRRARTGETTKEKAARIKAFEARHTDWSTPRIGKWCGCSGEMARQIRLERVERSKVLEPATQSGAMTWPEVADEQKSYMRGKRYQAEKRKDGGHGDQKSAAHNGPPKETAERLAEEFNVGRNTIKRDADFAEAVDVIGLVAYRWRWLVSRLGHLLTPGFPWT